LRVDLAGGTERLGEAIATGGADADLAVVLQVAAAFGPRGLAALRRLASLAHVLELPLPLKPRLDPHQPVIRLDPGDDQVEWTDQVFRVAWNVTADELRAVVGQ
ncbi:hypothetical protein, partial [Trebonia sp.]|uniref:hypothetical protein n=1 Tax=Trebonia sp. TaxID=2767075 RepID=UPI00260E1F59